MTESRSRYRLRKNAKSLSNGRLMRSLPQSPKNSQLDFDAYKTYITPRENTRKVVDFEKQTFDALSTEQPCLSLPKLLPGTKAESIASESTRSDIEQTLNLQYIVDIEKWLHSFYSRYGTARETSEIDRYFELIDEYNSMNLHLIYQEKNVRAAIRQSMWLEITSVILHWFFVREKLEEKTEKSEVRSMLWNVYQNFLILIEYILHRLPPITNENNKWIEYLLKCPAKIDNHRYKKFGYKQMNRNSANIAKSLARFDEPFKLQFSCMPIFRVVLYVSKSYKHLSQKKVALLMTKAFTKSVDKNEPKTQNLENIEVKMPVPFLPPSKSHTKSYTLVLDLDETLVHWTDVDSLQFLIRPGCQEFLQDVSEFYDVAIFTAGLQYYADAILDDLDPNRVLIKHRLYRGHTTLDKDNETYIKDLSKLGRPLNKTVIVDNTPENFKHHRQNGIFIRSWYGSKDDSALPALAQMLVRIAKQKPSDIRCGLKRYQEEVISKVARGRHHRGFHSPKSVTNQNSSLFSPNNSKFFSPQLSPFISPNHSPNSSMIGIPTGGIQQASYDVTKNIPPGVLQLSSYDSSKRSSLQQLASYDAATKNRLSIQPFVTPSTSREAIAGGEKLFSASLAYNSSVMKPPITLERKSYRRRSSIKN